MSDTNEATATTTGQEPPLLTSEKVVAEAATAKKKNARKPPLRRPRGKRGGIKNRKPAAKASSTAAEAAAAAAKQGKRADKESEKAPATTAAVDASAAAVAEHARQIARFHTLEKQLARPGLDTDEEARLRAEQEALGGLAAYQDASLHGGDKQRGGETGKWCAQVLAEERGKEPLRLLDVGALSGTAYQKYAWIDTTSIDLNPRAEHVQQCDFFKFPVPQSPFDVVALSLVVNFIGDLAERGRMLLHAHRYVDAGGWLFLVLPLACVANSRYCTHARLRDILDAAGWSVVRQDDSARLTRWLCRETRKTWDKRVFKKEEIVKGVTLNNFCIVLRDGKAKIATPTAKNAKTKASTKTIKSKSK